MSDSRKEQLGLTLEDDGEFWCVPDSLLSSPRPSSRYVDEGLQPYSTAVGGGCN